MKSGNVICILAKNPRNGEVKSGLGKVIGEKQAAFLARALLLDVMAAVLKVPRVNTVIAHWPPDAATDFADIINIFKIEENNKGVARKADAITLIPQQGESINERLVNLSSSLFASEARRVLFVCSDTPLLDPSILKAALELLKENRAVLGPTFDGGFYLLGLDGHYPEIVNGINWSPGIVYRQISEKLEARKMPWQELEISYDIDRPEELEQLYCDIDNLRLAGQDEICRHTEKCLANLKKLDRAR